QLDRHYVIAAPARNQIGEKLARRRHRETITKGQTVRRALKHAEAPLSCATPGIGRNRAGFGLFLHGAAVADDRCVGESPIASFAGRRIVALLIACTEAM